VAFSDPFGLCDNPENPLCRAAANASWLEKSGAGQLIRGVAEGTAGMGFIRLKVSGSLGPAGGSCSVSLLGAGCQPALVGTRSRWSLGVGLSAKLRSRSEGEPAIGVTVPLRVDGLPLTVSVSNEEAGIGLGVSGTSVAPGLPRGSVRYWPASGGESVAPTVGAPWDGCGAQGFLNICNR